MAYDISLYQAKIDRENELLDDCTSCYLEKVFYDNTINMVYSELSKNAEKKIDSNMIIIRQLKKEREEMEKSY